MYSRGDYVKIKKRTGKYKLWRLIETDNGPGWSTTGPDGKLHYFLEKDIKKKVRT